jgi:NADPH:quinone reductase-like Zn-dependent oxidoreductase
MCRRIRPTVPEHALDEDFVGRRLRRQQLHDLVEVCVERQSCRVDLLLSRGGDGGRQELGHLDARPRELRPERFCVGVHAGMGIGGEYSAITCHVERLAPVPAGLRVTEAAAVPVDALTADQGITGILAVKAADRVLITAAAGGLGHFAVQMARALGAIVIATASPRDHELVHRLGAAVVVDQTVQDWPDQVREMTGGGADQVLACSASSLPGAARAARDGATIATPVRAGLPDAYRVDWQLYEGRSSGSRLIRMAPRFDDGTLTVHVPAMYYWHDVAQAHRAVERGIPGEVVLIVDDDLAAALEV